MRKLHRKVLITDYVWPSLDPEREVLEQAGFELVVAPDSSEETLTELAGDVDAIMFCFAGVTAKVLRAARKCVVASRYGIGVDNIDIPVCTELGIVVTNVPDYCIDEVTDHTMGMIIALNRRLAVHSQEVKTGNWANVRLDRPMRRMRGATIGIVGYGRIGRAIAAKAVAFGLNILAYDPYLSPGADTGDARTVSLDELLAESDFVTVHVPLTDATRHLIGRDQLAAMKQDAILVNAARGGLVDETALAEALESGHLAGAGLDVMEPAPPDPRHPLLKQENVIVTPHTAFFSQASTLELETRTAWEVVRVADGGEPENFINPDVRGKSRVGL
jgi:D-3-phosphoglycerate dehydrogenase